jgi:thiamine-phosphate pyrophosphorylase
VAAAVAGGVDWVQVRDRELGARELLALVESLARAAREAARARSGELRVIVNRRVDVALAAGADGVQLGFDALPAQEARRLLGEEACIGISTHSPEEVGCAPPAASYAQLAPIFAPLSKAGSRAPLGLAALRRAAGAGLPVLAQGGIEAGNAGAALDAGAGGVAVTGAILLADDPGRAASALRAALDRGRA